MPLFRVKVLYHSKLTWRVWVTIKWDHAYLSCSAVPEHRLRMQYLSTKNCFSYSVGTVFMFTSFSFIIMRRWKRWSEYSKNSVNVLVFIDFFWAPLPSYRINRNSLACGSHRVQGNGLIPALSLQPSAFPDFTMHRVSDVDWGPLRSWSFTDYTFDWKMEQKYLYFCTR